MFAITNSELITMSLLGVIALVLLVVALYLFVGLFQARSLLRRELTAYFVSPIAYAVLVVFLAVTGILFYLTFDLLTTTGPRGTEWPMRSMFANALFWAMFLFIPPLLTMRLFAEERSSGTLEALMTAPLRDWQIVLSKYLACLVFYVLLWVPTLVYLPALLGTSEPEWDLVNAWTPGSIGLVAGLALVILGFVLLIPRLGTPWRVLSVVLFLIGGIGAGVMGYWHYTIDDVHLLTIPVSLDPYPVLSTYLGLFLAGAMFLALGLLVSSLVRDQIVAGLIAMALGLVFIAAGFWRPEEDGGQLDRIVYFFSVPLHFDRAFTRGVVDTRPVILYLSVSVLCLFLTVRSLESRRWQ